ncbi:hypothetical protein O181_125986, partial [Austropuccinia psidii MF-1]|nr:hypothetical protein [Austropuccinia psidii MF-1]
CRALYAPSGVSPAFVPQQRPTLVMLADKHTRNVCLLSTPSNHKARGVLAQDALARTPLWSTMMKPYPSTNGHRDPKQANGNNSGQLALCPQPLIDYPANEGWQWQDDIQTWANHQHVLSLMGFKRQKQNSPNPPRHNSPVPSLPCEQTTRQATPGPSGTQWSEELFREPSIPGLSSSYQPPEDNTTHEPEPEAAPRQSTKEHF